MELRREVAHEAVPASMFSGDVTLQILEKGQDPSRLRVNAVHFPPGARTAWHRHAVGQTLVVIEGTGRVQSRGGDITEIRDGDTIYTPPGEWHWHGAGPEAPMTHLAIWEAPVSGPESDWADLVTDHEYDGAKAAEHR